MKQDQQFYLTPSRLGNSMGLSVKQRDFRLVSSHAGQTTFGASVSSFMTQLFENSLPFPITTYDPPQFCPKFFLLSPLLAWNFLPF